MYTGIVQGTETVADIQPGDNFFTLFITNHHGLFDDLFVGASVAINGTCLTATGFVADRDLATFDVSALTASVTTLQFLKKGDDVNVERSTRSGLENGGHSLYGHVEGMAEVKRLKRTGATLHMDIVIPRGDIKYFFLKGFIGLHGCSLTVNRVDRIAEEVSVDLIPETLRLTTLKQIKVGEPLNYEIDQMTRTMVDTLEGIHLR